MLAEPAARQTPTVWRQGTVSAQRIVKVNNGAANALIDNGSTRRPAGLVRFLWRGIADTAVGVVEATGVEGAKSVTTDRLE